MIDYKKRDKARWLFRQGHSIEYLEERFGCKMSSAWIPVSWINKREMQKKRKMIQKESIDYSVSVVRSGEKKDYLCQRWI